MFRSFYSALVQMHPPAFRKRFGDEMLSIFDDTGLSRRPAALGDAALSLFRQWLLRPEFHDSKASAPRRLAGAPMFLVLDDDPKLSPSRLIAGGGLALLSFVAASFLISHGGNSAATSIGSGLSSLFGVHVYTNAAGETGTEVRVAQPPSLDLNTIRLFRSERVLVALDVNQDFVLSPLEIANAPAALTTLDRNGDGTLDISECLPQLVGGKIAPDAVLMRIHLVLAALDTDHDGLISASEIRDSPAALRALDENGDGRLTPEEIFPQLKPLISVEVTSR